MRDRILDAASDIIVNDGVASVTLRSVAARSGLTEADVADVYSSIDPLLHDLMRREYQGIRRLVADNIERDPAGGLLSRIFHYSLSATYERPLARALYLLEPDGLSTIVRATRDTPYLPKIDADRGFLCAMREAGMIRADVDVDHLEAILSAFMAGAALNSAHELDHTLAGLVMLLERGVDADVTDTEPGKRALYDLIVRDELT